MDDADIIDPENEEGAQRASDKDASPSVELSKLRERLKAQLTCLGIAWILFGGVRVWGAFNVPEPGPQVSLLVREVAPEAEVVAQSAFEWQLASGVGFIITGILVCGRVIWALYVALALTYFELLQAVFRHDALMVILWLPLVFFAHWAVRRVQQLRRAGIAIGDTRRSVLTIRGGR